MERFDYGIQVIRSSGITITRLAIHNEEIARRVFEGTIELAKAHYSVHRLSMDMYLAVNGSDVLQLRFVHLPRQSAPPALQVQSFEIEGAV